MTIAARRADELGKTRPGRARGLTLAALISAAALAVAGCSGPDSPGRAVAQATGFATPTPEAPDFVSSSRPPNPDFISIPQGPAVQGKPKTPEELRKAESELENLRAKLEAEAKADAAAIR